MLTKLIVHNDMIIATAKVFDSTFSEMEGHVPFRASLTQSFQVLLKIKVILLGNKFFLTLEIIFKRIQRRMKNTWDMVLYIRDKKY